MLCVRKSHTVVVALKTECHIFRGEVEAEKMTGSWAGAMGQCQFMPSNVQKFAVDYDGDGKADIWNSRSDALASIANFLVQHGTACGVIVCDTNEPAKCNSVSQTQINVFIGWSTGIRSAVRVEGNGATSSKIEKRQGEVGIRKPEQASSFWHKSFNLTDTSSTYCHCHCQGFQKVCGLQ